MGKLKNYDCHKQKYYIPQNKPSWSLLNLKQASKKNFLLVAEEGNDRMEDEFGEGRIYLRFGKMSKTRFTLDFRHPFSPAAALGIVCSAFAKKRAVT